MARTICLSSKIQKSISNGYHQMKTTTLSNDRDFIISLLDMDRDSAVSALRTHLPNLSTAEATRHYLVVIPIILEWCLETGWINEGQAILRTCENQRMLRPYESLFRRWLSKYFSNNHLKRKVVPMSGQGVFAQPPKNGMDSALSWLKSIRLHKYWPVISHFNYQQLLSLTDENIDETVINIGATVITKGARNKLLRHIKELKARSEMSSLPQNTEVRIQNKITKLRWITTTPLTCGPEPDGTYLLSSIKNALVDVLDAVEYSTDSPQLVREAVLLLDDILENDLLREFVEDILPRRNDLIRKEALLKWYEKSMSPTSSRKVIDDNVHLKPSAASIREASLKNPVESSKKISLLAVWPCVENHVLQNPWLNAYLGKTEDLEVSQSECCDFCVHTQSLIEESVNKLFLDF